MHRYVFFEAQLGSRGHDHAKRLFVGNSRLSDNLLVTKGPNIGERREEPSSYIYRLDKNTFTEVRGMHVDDKTAAKMNLYQRVVLVH